MDAYELRFGGIARLVGRKAWQQLRQARVAVIGIGGVGSWSAEALVRSGIEKISLIDLDEVCITNTNRQLHTLHGEIGRAKVSVMAERLKAINPAAEIQAIQDFFTAETSSQLLEPGYDLIIDAIDSTRNKCLLIASCRERGIPLVSVGGSGGRCDPSQIRIADLSASTHDALLRQTRRRLRQHYDFPSEGSLGVPTVFSLEDPVFPGQDGEVCTVRDPNTKARLDCEGGYGSASFVTGSFGFAAASAGIRLYLEHQRQKSSPSSL